MSLALASLFKKDYLIEEIRGLHQLRSERIEADIGCLEVPIKSLGHGLVPSPNGVMESVGADSLLQVPRQHLDSCKRGRKRVQPVVQRLSGGVVDIDEEQACGEMTGAEYVTTTLPASQNVHREM